MAGGLAMKRDATVTSEGDLGSRQKHASGLVIDKSKQIKHLRKTVGKKSRRQSTRKAGEQFPSTPSISSQLSTETRHSVRANGAVEYLSVSQVGLAARAQATGSSTEAPVKNEFRSKLAALPASDFEFGKMHAAVLPRLDALTRALFLEGRCLDVQSLSNAVFPESPTDSINTTFFQEYSRLVASGRVLTSPTGKAGGGETPYAFDLLRAIPFKSSGSLRTLLASYDASTASSSAKIAVIAAARVLLDLEPRATTAIVLKEAARVPFDALHGLASRFAANATIAGRWNKKTVANFSSAIRALISHGLREDLFPLYFPALRPIDGWSELVNTAFPLAANGKTDGMVRKARCGLFALFAEIRDTLNVADPSALTAAHVDIASRAMSLPHRAKDQTKIAGLKKVAGKALGDWSHPVVSIVIAALEARRPIPGVRYLQHKDNPKAPINSLENFLAALRSHGFGDEWDRFFRWYLEYSSLDWREIDDQQSAFPARRPKRQLAFDTFMTRLRAARAYLGAALELFPGNYMRMTPQDVFGAQYRPLTRHIYKSWEASAKISQSVSHRASAGLHHLVCGGGMMARALFDREVHHSTLSSRSTTASI
jgi:hypothetical protein